MPVAAGGAFLPGVRERVGASEAAVRAVSGLRLCAEPEGSRYAGGMERHAGGASGNARVSARGLLYARVRLFLYGRVAEYHALCSDACAGLPAFGKLCRTGQLSWLCGVLVIAAGLYGAALILFTVFSKGREARVRRKIFKSISEEDKKKPEDTIKPVFFERIGGQELPVQLGFYSPGRIVKIVMILLMVNASTCILAWILTAFKCMGSGDWTLFQQLDYSYNIVWLCLALPISMVGFAVFGRIEVYDSPVIFQLLENGKRKRIHQKRENRKTLLMRWKNVRETIGNWALPLFIVLPLFAMTVYMIMNPWP